MIYTNSKIKQSNGPGAECQIPFIISEERRSRMRGEGRQGQALPRRAAASWHSKRSRPRPCSYPELEETPISRFGTERPKPVTNSPERGRQSCFCRGKGSGWRKRLQAHHYRGPEVERRQRSLLRPWSFQSCLPQLSLLPGTICRGGEQQSTQPTGKEAQAALWLPNAALTLIWSGQGTQDESHSPI